MNFRELGKIVVKIDFSFDKNYNLSQKVDEKNCGGLVAHPVFVSHPGLDHNIS